MIDTKDFQSEADKLVRGFMPDRCGISEHNGRISVPVGISNRHVHLSEADLNHLFGSGYQLNVKKELVQPGQFAADETVTLVGPKGVLQGVRILGPVRAATQVELSKSDARTLGVSAPVCPSGKVVDIPQHLTIVGPKASITINKGVIAAWRHVHLDPETASRAGLKDGDMIQLKVGGDRGLTWDQIMVRAGTSHMPEFHIDTDEANASGLNNNDKIYL